MSRRRFVAGWMLLSCAMLGACGRSGDPVASLTLPADNVRDLQARLGCQSVVLSFTAPQKRADGTEIDSALRFEIYRRRYKFPDTPTPGPTSSPTPEATPSGASAAEATPQDVAAQASLPAPTPAIPAGPFDKLETVTLERSVPQKSRTGPLTPTPGPPPPSAMSYTDRGEKDPLELGYTYLYQVVAVDEDGEVSAPSNTVQIDYGLIPGPPQGLAGKASKAGVRLVWKKPAADCTGQGPAAVAGYNVYRRGEEPAFGPVPINAAPVTEASFLDETVAFDKIYTYAVRAVAPQTGRESDNSRPAAVEVYDLYAPEPPSSLVVNRSKEGVNLLWNPSPSNDVAGYHVYRQLRDSWDRLTQEPVAKTSYLDSTAEPRKKYRYRVTAVDRAIRKNESEPTETVGVDQP